MFTVKQKDPANIKKLTGLSEKYLSDCLAVCESSGITTLQATMLIGEMLETMFLGVSNMEAKIRANCL